MNLIYLTLDEIKGITGRIKSVAQIRWFRQNGFTVLQRADGMPLISRAHFEVKMGGFQAGSKSQNYQPNLGAL